MHGLVPPQTTEASPGEKAEGEDPESYPEDPYDAWDENEAEPAAEAAQSLR